MAQQGWRVLHPGSFPGRRNISFNVACERGWKPWCSKVGGCYILEVQTREGWVCLHATQRMGSVNWKAHESFCQAKSQALPAASQSWEVEGVFLSCEGQRLVRS